MNEKFCSCGDLLKKTLTPNSVHYARLDCPRCGFNEHIKGKEGKRDDTQTAPE